MCSTNLETFWLVCPRYANNDRKPALEIEMHGLSITNCRRTGECPSNEIGKTVPDSNTAHLQPAMSQAENTSMGEREENIATLGFPYFPVKIHVQ